MRDILKQPNPNYPDRELTTKPIASTTSKPTMRLRWVPKSMMQAADLKLQQAWGTVHYLGAQATKIETEWRDIPVEKE